MKKVVRLTESDLVRLVKRVINEQKSSSGFLPCKNNEVLSDCMKRNKITGRVMCSASAKQYPGQDFYQVKSGDTWDKIMNDVLNLNKFSFKYKSPDWESYSKTNLDANPKLQGNKMAIRAGDILMLIPYMD
jgi:hypothetical protein